jgi:RNA methyltransferase, TrmH family
VKITSTANARVKEIVRLRNRRARNESGLFIVEGFREIRRAIDAGIEMTELFVSPALYLGSNEDDLVARAPAEVVEVAEGPFRKMAYRDRPEGLLAVCRQFDTSLERIERTENALMLVVEAIEKPGNLGTMIRTATAAKVDGVIVADPTTDVFNPNVVRSSIGTLFVTPVAVCGTDDAIAWLRDGYVPICAATPGAEMNVWDAPLDRSVAMVVGAEQFGLSDAWLEAADLRVKIPMPGENAIDSLNAASSASILLFEAVRQRS